LRHLARELGDAREPLERAVAALRILHARDDALAVCDRVCRKLDDEREPERLLLRERLRAEASGAGGAAVRCAANGPPEYAVLHGSLVVLNGLTTASAETDRVWPLAKRNAVLAAHGSRPNVLLAGLDRWRSVAETPEAHRPEHTARYARRGAARRGAEGGGALCDPTSWQICSTPMTWPSARWTIGSARMCRIAEAPRWSAVYEKLGWDVGSDVSIGSAVVATRPMIPCDGDRRSNRKVCAHLRA
jgi:hypothetical protein